VTLDERILAYLDGSATPAETAELDRVLDADPAARERFARLCEQDGALRQILSCAPAAPRKARRTLVRPPSSGPSTPWAAIAFAAAALLFVLLVAGALSSGSDTPSRPPQQVVRPPRPVPAEIPEAAPPRPEPPPRIDPPKPPPGKVDPTPEFVVPKPEPRPEPRPEPTPEPSPKPEPVAPPPPPAPKVTEAVVVVARLERVKGQVQAESTPAKEGQALSAGQGVQTLGAESSVQLRMDTTVIEVAGETKIGGITNGTGKTIALDAGAVTAQVSKQPPGQPLVFVTPHAEARVLGTKLTLAVSATETRLEVREGRVRLTRRSDNSYVDVSAGQYAVASDAAKPVARKIPPPARALFVDGFEDDSRWVRLDGGFPTTTANKMVEVNLSFRPGDAYDGGGWHASGGLRTRKSFPVPFRVSVDVQVSHKHEDLNTLVVLMPNTAGPRTGKNEVAVRLRNGEYSVIVESQHLPPPVDAPNAALQTETWTIDFGLKDVALTLKGKEVLRRNHGLTIGHEYFVELQGTAKQGAPKDSYVRFDNVTIER